MRPPRRQPSRPPPKLKTHLCMSNKPLCGGGRDGKKVSEWLEHLAFVNEDPVAAVNCIRCIKLYINLIQTGTTKAK